MKQSKRREKGCRCAVRISMQNVSFYCLANFGILNQVDINLTHCASTHRLWTTEWIRLCIIIYNK